MEYVRPHLGPMKMTERESSLTKELTYEEGLKMRYNYYLIIVYSVAILALYIIVNKNWIVQRQLHKDERCKS
jgi:hypothetical protein